MRAGIALGSNLGDRCANLESAIANIRQLAIPPVLVSKFHETVPVGCPPGSPSFLNAAMEIGFSGDPFDLLDKLQEIERAHHRPDRRAINSPRTLDLDLLYCDDMVIEQPRLQLPHPRISQRRFVLEPLAEIVPDRKIPGCSHTIAEQLSELP